MEYVYDGKSCSFCGCTDVRKIYKGAEADVQCVKCGAVFYSPQHVDKEKAGKWTGRTEEISNESLYELSHRNKVN